MRSRAVARERGTVYVVVLAVISIVLTVSLSTLVNARSELSAAARTEEEALARSMARSGMEMAIAMMAADPGWRAGVSGGKIIPMAGFAGGKLSVEVVDPSDDDLLDDYSDPVELLAVAYYGQSIQRYRYRFDTSPTHSMNPDLVLKHHPVSYWPLWDLDGDEAVDLRGTGDAHLRGTISYTSQDPLGAYNMPTLHATNKSHYEISHVAPMEVDYGSISFWMNAASSYASATTVQAMVSKYRHNKPNTAQLAVTCTNGQVYLMVDHNGIFQYAVAGLIEADTWHHVAVTWGADGWRTYLDGVPGNTVNTPLGLGDAWTDDPNDSVLLFGACRGLMQRFGGGGAMGHFFTGKICEAAFFAYELSEEQIKDLASQPPTPLPLRAMPTMTERAVD